MFINSILVWLTSSACRLVSIIQPGSAFHTALWGMIFGLTDRKQAAVSHVLLKQKRKNNGEEIMSNEDILDIWDDFKKDYINYFKSDKDQAWH